MIESEIRKRDLKELIKLVSQYFPYESFLTKMGVPIKMFDKRSNLVFKEICHDKEWILIKFDNEYERYWVFLSWTSFETFIRFGDSWVGFYFK